MWWRENYVLCTSPKTATISNQRTCNLTISLNIASMAHVLLSPPCPFSIHKRRKWRERYLPNKVSVTGHLHWISVRCRDSAGNSILRKCLYYPNDSVWAIISRFRLDSVHRDSVPSISVAQIVQMVKHICGG
jgi:hypothetical protein